MPLLKGQKTLNSLLKYPEIQMKAVMKNMITARIPSGCLDTANRKKSYNEELT